MRWTKGIFRWVIIAFLLLILPGKLFSQTVYVATWGNDATGDGSQDKPYRTIQKGIDVCQEGGRVLVSAGTYNEAINIINKRIAIIGEGSDKTTITAEGLGARNTVNFFKKFTYIKGKPIKGASISGFRITGATGAREAPFYGYGIYCGFFSPSITNNTISGNANGGILCYDNTSPAITNNTISENGCGIGIACGKSSNPAITNNTISGNGDGIYCDWSSNPTITNNTISGNGGGGINCERSSNPTITNNTISENKWGISCSLSSPTITNNIISGNDAFGIVCSFSSNISPNIINNTISGNRFVGIVCENSSPEIYNNIITENSRCGIFNDSDYPGNPTIDYNNVWGNGPTGNINYYNCTPGANDISADPQFIGDGDYRLKPTSPCINKGTSRPYAIPLKDKDGNPRMVNGIDMGAYEYK